MKGKSNLIRVKRQMAETLGEKVDATPSFRATIGDGAGNVFTDATRNTVFIRRIGRGRIQRCLCTRVSARYNLKVIVGYVVENPKVLQVLDVDEPAMQARGGYTYMGHHHQAHEKDNVFGGDDVVWVRESQFLPLLMQPTDPVTMSVAIHPGRYRYRRTWHQWPGSLSIGDLSGFIPVAANRAVMVLFMVIAGSTTLVVQSSQEFFTSTAEEWRVYFTPDPLQDCVPIASIFFYNGMTEITWNEIYDMRLFLEAFYCGCGSGGEGDPHDLLSPTHQDTFTGGPVCGDLVVAGPTDSPYWRRLPVSANGSVLTNDGTDTSWSGYFLFGSAGQSYTFSSATGVVPTIPVAVAANQVAYYNAGAAGVTLTGSDEFVYTGGKLGVGRNAPVGHLDVYDVAINTTDDYYAIYNEHKKTLGATDLNDDMFGIYSKFTMDQVGGTIGHLYGAYIEAELNDGTLGGGNDLRGTFVYANLDGGTVGGDVWGFQVEVDNFGATVSSHVYGVDSYVDLNTGSTGGDVIGVCSWVDVDAGYTNIGGDVIGVYVYVDDDLGAIGNTYMVYLNEQDGVDYGVYQSGSALNVWGGSHQMADAAWVGNSGATARLGFDSSGPTDYAYVMGANFGVGTLTPGELVSAVKTQNALTRIAVSNPNAGNAARAGFWAASDVGSIYCVAYSSVFAGAYGGGFAYAGSAALVVDVAMTGLVIATGGADPIIFAISGTEEARIHSDGNICAGVTTPNVTGFPANYKIVTIQSGAADTGAVLELVAPDLTGANSPGQIRWINKDGGGAAVGRAIISAFRDGADDALGLSLWTEATGAAVSQKVTILGVGYVGINEITPDRLVHGTMSGAITAAIAYANRWSHTTSGAAAALFGVGQEHELEDAGGAMQVASETVTLWAAATAGAESPLYRGTTYPIGVAGPGYWGFWTWNNLDNNARTIVPNGAGDVTSGVTIMYRLSESGGGVDGNVVMVANGGSVDLYDDGTDVCTLSVAANGSVTVVRSVGATTFDLSLLMCWL